MSCKAIILAAGRGTRMREGGDAPSLTDSQRAAAKEGLKAMIPIGRPFLDYLLSNVADAGCERVCLVIGPGHSQVRSYYAGVQRERLEIEFAVQSQQLGTANALLAVADFAGDDDVLVLNGDNYYPTEALRSLVGTSGNAVVGFDRHDLIANSNIPAERIAAFSAIVADSDGNLANIVEKPSAASMEQLGGNTASLPPLVGMNCWRFRPTIFAACRAIQPSPRGEYELPDAVMHAIRVMGERFRVVVSNEGVLDLSNPRDIASVEQRLKQVQVRL